MYELTTTDLLIETVRNSFKTDYSSAENYALWLKKQCMYEYKKAYETLKDKED